MDTRPVPSTLGQILDATFGVYRRHFVRLVATVSAILLPAAVMESLGMMGVVYVRGLLSLVANVIVTAQASDALMGRPPSFLGSLRLGVRRFPAALLSIAFLIVTVVAVVLPTAVLLAVGRPNVSGLAPLMYWVVAGLVGAATIAVLCWIMVRYFALIQVATLEPGASPADRSATLARGAYGKIALTLLMGGVITFVPSALIGLASGFLTALRDRGEVPAALVVAVAVVSWIVKACMIPFGTVLTTALYHDRRASTDELAAARVEAEQPPEPAATRLVPHMSA